MAHLEYCSNCGEKNIFGSMEGQNRFYCKFCKKIHYENPKPTATLICMNENSEPQDFTMNDFEEYIKNFDEKYKKNYYD